MRHTRATTTAAVAFAVLAATASAGTWSWQRQLEFAKALCTRQYYDIGDIVLGRLEADKNIIGVEKAHLYKELGEYYSDLAEAAVTEKRDINAFVQYLSKSRAYFVKFLNHNSIKTNPRYAAGRFEIRMRLSRISLAVADGHIRVFDNPKTSKADKEKHKKLAVDIFKRAIAEFQLAVGEKDKEVKRIKGLSPQDESLRKTWRERVRRAREELFRVRLERSMARVRFATLLKKIKAPAKEWQAQLGAAEKDYRQLLLDYSGTPGATQANLELARCLLERGAKHDKEVLDRLGEVWEKRGGFRRFRQVPCEAAQMKASILIRQKKPKVAIPVIDGLLAFASGGAWNPEEKTVQGVIEALQAVEGASREQFSERQVALSFMMEAEFYAAVAAAAEKAKEPGKKIRLLYGAAYDISLGVLKVRRFLDPKYADLIERWRMRSGRPLDPAILWQKYLDAISKRKYLDAARLMGEIASQQTTLPRAELAPDKKREMWFTVGQCYHAAGRDHEAAIAFLAAGRWFPEPAPEAYKAASAAVSAANAQFKRTKHPSDEKFLRWVQEQAEALNPYGKGGIYIKQAETARKEGKFQRALTLLDQVRPDQDAYPHALYHYALTYKAMFSRMSAADKAGMDGKRAVARMRASFDKLLAYYKTKYPELKREGDQDAIDRLVGVVGAALAMYTDFYLRPPYKDSNRVLEITTDLQKQYPGVESSPGFPVICFSRMRAAYSLMAKADLDTGRKLLRVVEDTWKTLGSFSEFRYLDKAAAMAAQCHFEMSKKLTALAKTATDKAKQQGLEQQAGEHKARALDFYLQLVALAPRQTLRTYRYILHSLRSREHKLKSEDWRKIVALAPKVIEMFKGDRRAAADLLFVKATLGIAYHGLKNYREAIPPLQEVDDAYEKHYQDQLLPYRERKRKWQEDPNRNPKPGRPPRRHASQPEIMEKLAFCYLAASSRSHYDRALKTYIVLTRIYAPKPAKYWIVFYNLCETYRRLDLFEQAVKQIDRAYLRDPSMGGRSSKARFLGLVGRIQREVAKLKNTQRAATLEPMIKRLLKNLRK